MYHSDADPDPGSCAFLISVSGMQINPDPGNIPDPRSFLRELRNSFLGSKTLKFFYADPDPGSCPHWIRDRKNRIRDEHPGTATLMYRYVSTE
jgi:hypothetical protein